MAAPNRTDWTAAQIVFVERAKCPSCGAEKPRSVRTCPRESDGSSTRRVVCRSCGEKFLVVTE